MVYFFAGGFNGLDEFMFEQVFKLCPSGKFRLRACMRVNHCRCGGK